MQFANLNSFSTFPSSSTKNILAITEQQKTSNKLQEAEKQTGIKAETQEIKEETKLMTVQDASEKLGTHE